MKTKITILLFSVFALASCNKPNTEPTEPDYAKVEFTIDSIVYEDLTFRVYDLQIFNLQENETYPNGSFTSEEARKVLPQTFETKGGYNGGGNFYNDLADFDGEGKVFLAIRFAVIADGYVEREEMYAISALPVTELEAGVHYRFNIRNPHMAGTGDFRIMDYEIIEWEN